MFSFLTFFLTCFLVGLFFTGVGQEYLRLLFLTFQTLLFAEELHQFQQLKLPWAIWQWWMQDKLHIRWVCGAGLLSGLLLLWIWLFKKAILDS